MKQRAILRYAYNWISPIVDPLRVARAIRGFGPFFSDYRAYRRLPGAESLRMSDASPSLHERGGSHDLDPHYFYINAWAMRRILASHASRHVDFGSQTVLAAHLSSMIPVAYVDYRPLRVRLTGLQAVSGDLVKLPFRNDAIGSMSCLHVAEHIGLGRYGDPLDPEGTKKAARELARVLRPDGNLYFAVPVGRPRVCFNAHRIHAAETVREYLNELDLMEYSVISDKGEFHERAPLSACRDDEYACGMFWFRKRTAPA